MDIEVNDYREFFDRKYFVEFDEGNPTIWDAEKSFVRISCEDLGDEFFDEIVLANEEADELGESVRAWKGHTITRVQLSNCVYLNGKFVVA